MARRLIRTSRWEWGDHPSNPIRGVRITAPNNRIYIPARYFRAVADFLHEAADDLDAIERGNPINYDAAGYGLHEEQ